MKYDLAKIMSRAWRIYRKTANLSFSEALHRAWLSVKAEVVNQKRIEQSKQQAGITEDTNTWDQYMGRVEKVRLRSDSRIQSLVWMRVDLGVKR